MTLTLYVLELDILMSVYLRAQGVRKKDSNFLGLFTDSRGAFTPGTEIADVHEMMSEELILSQRRYTGLLCHERNNGNPIVPILTLPLLRATITMFDSLTDHHRPVN